MVRERRMSHDRKLSPLYVLRERFPTRWAAGMRSLFESKPTNSENGGGLCRMMILLNRKFRKKVLEGPASEKLVTNRWRASWFDVARSRPLRKTSSGTLMNVANVPSSSV